MSERPPIILPGGASRDLAEEICRELGQRLGQVEVRRFSDSELFVKVVDNIRGSDVYIVQSTSAPANETLMELLLIIDAVRRASADRITAVVPYMGYARQDRKEQGRVALSAKLVANLFEAAGIDRLITIDLHSGQTQGFFDIPVDHLMGGFTLINYVKQSGLRDYVVVSPDVGNVKMARNYAELLGAPLAIVDKRRPAPNVSEVMAIIGEEQIKDKTALIFDDMIDTAGTICNASTALRERGAREVLAFATHGVFSGPAFERLQSAPVKEVVVTNTIRHPAAALPPKIKVLTIAPLLAQAIDRIHTHRSVSELFRQRL